MKTRIGVLLGLHIALSLCFVALALFPQYGRLVLEPIWDVVWIFGPPALLLYKLDYVIPYLVGTALSLPLLVGAWKANTVMGRVVQYAGAALAWSVAGVLVYAPGI